MRVCAYELLNIQDIQRCVPCYRWYVSPGLIFSNQGFLLPSIHSAPPFFTSVLSARYPIASLCSLVSETLPQPATKFVNTGQVHRAVDAPAPHLRAAPRSVHIKDRGRGGNRWWRVGRGHTESEDQSWVSPLLPLVSFFVSLVFVDLAAARG